MSDTSGVGQQGVSDAASDHNQTHYLLRQHLGDVRTSVPVKVIAVHGGGVGPPPTVDVQVVIKQMDGAGNVFSHGTIYGIPCTRSQAGNCVIINDPQIGDTGLMSVSDRNMSSLIANNGQESQPGSYRRHDLADGVYHGPMLNQQTPQHYIQFDKDQGITINSPVALDYNGVKIDKDGNITTPGNITAGFGTTDSVTLLRHTHSGTSQPTPGT